MLYLDQQLEPMHRNATPRRNSDTVAGLQPNNPDRILAAAVFCPTLVCH